ncbi:MAG: hypothetical protein ACK5KK_05815, partial [Microbacterium sp.]
RRFPSEMDVKSSLEGSHGDRRHAHSDAVTRDPYTTLLDATPGGVPERGLSFNRRHTRNRGLVFMRLLQRAVASEPVTYRALVRISRPKATHPAGVHTQTRRRPGTLDVETIDPPWHRPRPPRQR